MPGVTVPSDELSISTADGWTLSVLHMQAADPVGVAVLGHAMMVDRRSMDRPRGGGLASTLAANGWHVLLADVRGHGASGPIPEEGGNWGYDDVVFFDLPALVAEARRLHPGLPVALLGHSLVGHMSMAAAGSGAYRETPPPDLHVLIAVNTWAWGLDPARDLLRARDMALFLLFTKVFGRFPSRLVRMGPASEARTYVGDLGRFLFSGHLVETQGRSPFELQAVHEDWQRELHSFGWMRDLRAADSQISRQNARALVEDWIKFCGRWHDIGWEASAGQKKLSYQA